jgi:hypothetical protein
MKAILLVEITSNGERLGTCTPDEFRASCKGPRTAFLAELVRHFNCGKERCGEPERAAVVFPKKAGKILAG